MEVFEYLEELSKNNNKVWFDTNKERYQNVRSQMVSMFDAINDKLQIIESIGVYKVYRIYRDVRFSKDKKPYKTHISAIYMRQQPRNRGSFYVHIEPGKSFIAGGFFGPEKEDLYRIRKAIELEDDLEKILQSAKIQEMFGSLSGDRLKRTPKDFDASHPRISLILNKQFFLKKDFSNEDVLSDNFINRVQESYQAMHDFFDYMTSVLTTDANGVSLFE